MTSAPPKRPRGRPAMPKEQQRQRLIDAAFRTLAKSNYEKTSVADVVREAGMSSRSFYQHFKSKEDLVSAIVREQGDKFIGELSSVMRDTLDPLARADRALRAFLELFPNQAVDLERLGGEAGQQVREARRHYVRAMTDLVLRWLERLKEQGQVARIPDRASIEFALTGIEGLSFRYYSEGRRDELLAMRPALLRVFLRALDF
jgi:AcrR family transcriptional regulator